MLYRNLIENALKHAQTDAFLLQFTVEEDGDGNFVFGVLNTGSTIHASESEQIFNLFNKSANKPNVHAIGLAICKRIVDFHAGCIWAESDDSRVHIKFKLSEN